MTTPLTSQQLDEIEARAAHLYEHATTTVPNVQDDFDQLSGTDVPALLAEVRRLTDRVQELEAYAYGCDAEGCTIPHSSWCEAAKKSAAGNNGCTCGKPWAGHPQPHAMHCWIVNPPRAEVDEMRKKVAEVTAGRDAAAIELREAAQKAIAKAEAERDATRTKTLTTEADEIVAYCPDHGSKDGVWMDCHCAVADDMRRRASTPA